MQPDQNQMAEWLYDAVQALLAGDQEYARNLLLQVVEADEQSEEGWLWLSGAVDSPDDQQIALENVLEINPANAYARRGLEMLGRR
ncbi:MAG: hypothetical protein HC876_14310 [Chloroflexaceae bacterium]|nr:hypothetical protein [Chloroflexaceae bacterium]NJO06591.1 hypothetical protein [Chloroflexaceae bacterium]